jgi:hypothetical protein
MQIHLQIPWPIPLTDPCSQIVSSCTDIAQRRGRAQQTDRFGEPSGGGPPNPAQPVDEPSGAGPPGPFEQAAFEARDNDGFDG